MKIDLKALGKVASFNWLRSLLAPLRGVASRLKGLFTISYWRRKENQPNLHQTFSLRYINIVLIVLGGLLFLYLLGDIFLLGRYLTEGGQKAGIQESVTSGAGDDDIDDSSPLAAVGSMKPFSHYESVFRRRNIFQATPAMAREITAPAKRPIRLGELAANLSVNGIFLDRNPQAIIVDRVANQTYYVTEGRYIGDILVKTIEKGKVVLTYKGEEMDLVF